MSASLKGNVAALVAAGKGIHAADETVPALTMRFGARAPTPNRRKPSPPPARERRDDRGRARV
jgi:hypothetical protein